MTSTPAQLTLTLHNAPFKVSNLSSLFRSLQAAVRETAAAGEPIESIFSSQQGPFLVTDMHLAEDGSLMLSMWFADRENRPLEERSDETFSRTFAELERAILRVPQQTFWGAPAYAYELHADESRILRFISLLRVFRSATLAYRGRTLTLEDGLFSSERT